MTDKTTTPSARSLEPGTAWLSGLIVATLTGGVAVLSASVLSAVLVALGITAALALALGFL
ncbi:hypothetical protein, partial [Nocardia bovistercoris]